MRAVTEVQREGLVSGNKVRMRRDRAVGAWWVVEGEYGGSVGVARWGIEASRRRRGRVEDVCVLAVRVTGFVRRRDRVERVLLKEEATSKLEAGVRCGSSSSLADDEDDGEGGEVSGVLVWWPDM